MHFDRSHLAGTIVKYAILASIFATIAPLVLVLIAVGFVVRGHSKNMTTSSRRRRIHNETSTWRLSNFSLSRSRSRSRSKNQERRNSVSTANVQVPSSTAPPNQNNGAGAGGNSHQANTGTVAGGSGLSQLPPPSGLTPEQFASEGRRSNSFSMSGTTGNVGKMTNSPETEGKVTCRVSKKNKHDLVRVARRLFRMAFVMSLYGLSGAGLVVFSWLNGSGAGGFLRADFYFCDSFSRFVELFRPLPATIFANSDLCQQQPRFTRHYKTFSYVHFLRTVLVYSSYSTIAIWHIFHSIDGAFAQTNATPKEKRELFLPLAT